MSRPLRIQYPYAWYHVMNRGADRCDVFHTYADRLTFLELLHDISDIFGIEIHGYCLMDNHYHLLVCTPSANLARAMRHLNGTYTLRFNRSHSRDGPLFRGRYKSILIGDDSYLLNVSRYIHLNPLEANIVDEAEDYPWSSYPQFLGLESKEKWLQTQHVLAHFSDGDTAQEYKAFVECGVDKELTEFYDQKNVPAILGTEEFIKETLETLSDDKINNSIPDVNRVVKIPPIDEIILATAEYFNLPIESLKLSTRGHSNWPRTLAIFISRRYFGYKGIELSEAFTGISSSSIYGLLQRAARLINNDAKYQTDFQLLLNRLSC